MTPEHRISMIEWMFAQTPLVIQELDNFSKMWHIKDSNSFTGYTVGSLIMALCQADPVTVKTGKDWSAITILTFKSWAVRQAWRAKFEGEDKAPLLYNGYTPVPGKHIKTSPGIPAYQRKFEAPIRVLLSVLNRSDEHKGAVFTTLWPQLTVMSPQTTKDFDPDHNAIARIVINENCGQAKVTMFIHYSILPILEKLSQQVHPDGAHLPYTVWEDEWDRQFLGRQAEEDRAEEQTAAVILTTMQGRKTIGRGIHY
jgi:hypothetical protein